MFCVPLSYFELFNEHPHFGLLLSPPECVSHLWYRYGQQDI